MSCDALPDAFLEARLSGAIDETVHWSTPAMSCDGMQRPDNQGFRVTFSGAASAGRITLVFGISQLGEGESGRAVPVNVTVIREGGAVYGTRGNDKCVLDNVEQTELMALAPQETPQEPPPEPPPGTSKPRHWRIDARGFCLEPARSIVQPQDAILLSTFDFRGQITWDPDPPPSTPLVAPKSPPAR